MCEVFNYQLLNCISVTTVNNIKVNDSEEYSQLAIQNMGETICISHLVVLLF